MNLKKIVVAIAVAGCLQGVQAHEVNAHAESLCTANEVVVAACFIKGKPQKVLSVCSSNVAAKASHVAYRFGTRKKTEMSYLVNGSDKGKRMYRGTYVGASNQTTLYWFNNGVYTYKVAIPGTGVGHLSVLKNDKLILSKDCSSNVLGDVETKNSLFVEKSADETFEMWNKGE